MRVKSPSKRIIAMQRARRLTGDITKCCVKSFRRASSCTEPGIRCSKYSIFIRKADGPWKTYGADRVKEQPYQHRDYPVEKCDTLFLYKSRHRGSGILPPFPDALFLSDREKSRPWHT